VKTVFVVASGVGVALSASVASGRPILARRWGLLLELGVWALAWLVAVIAALRLPRRWAVAAIVAAGVALRVSALAGPPTTSDDLYRYSWDGRVQAAGIDPYRAPPTGPTLVALREPWLWPSPAGCAALRRPAGCTRINRPAERTIYPPLAEAWFAAAYRLSGIGARHKVWQVAGLTTEVTALILLPVALTRWRRDPRWTALYALSPAPVLEIVNNGHVDGLAVVCIVAALAIAAGAPRRGRDVAFGLLIGAAALVKLYPALLLVTIAAVPGVRWRSVARASVSAALLAVIAYLPHVLRVGVHVAGYLPGYLREEHYTTGGRFLLASAARLPPALAGPASVAAVAAAGCWVVIRRPPPPTAATVLVGTLLLAASPVQPWYAVMLLACASVAVRPSWAAVLVAGYPYFFAVILANQHAAEIGEAAYAVAVCALLAAATRAPRGRIRAAQTVGALCQTSSGVRAVAGA
jgi:hypothetical protein